MTCDGEWLGARGAHPQSRHIVLLLTVSHDGEGVHVSFVPTDQSTHSAALIALCQAPKGSDHFAVMYEASLQELEWPLRNPNGRTPDILLGLLPGACAKRPVTVTVSVDASDAPGVAGGSWALQVPAPSAWTGPAGGLVPFWRGISPWPVAAALRASMTIRLLDESIPAVEQPRILAVMLDGRWRDALLYAQLVRAPHCRMPLVHRTEEQDTTCITLPDLAMLLEQHVLEPARRAERKAQTRMFWRELMERVWAPHRVERGLVELDW